MAWWVDFIAADELGGENAAIVGAFGSLGVAGPESIRPLFERRGGPEVEMLDIQGKSGRMLDLKILRQSIPGLATHQKLPYIPHFLVSLRPNGGGSTTL